ncbi:serine/threonine protein phosphatase [Cellulomonas bogoriensis 69B4 = DSM 16987]|uniref:Serine/threonine protein phosphatase n=1 Tax=Cellulomonas bogoriensis 69B4 = DSM 16987 TaxID=1386082 RepID=A0A0A0BSA9_9CELL|nr:serine/threonine protein phosphatase [Cellulomonas bogoriensis 69B4 = DSM 16987]
MVNFIATGQPDDPLAAVRDRALRASDVSFVVTAATPDGPIVWVNDAFTRTTGYSAEEVLGRNPAFLQGPATDVAQARLLGSAVAGERSATTTLLNYRKDGTTFWNQVSVSPVPDDDGTVSHWVGIQVDVTDQVRHEVEQQESIAAERRARSGLTIVSQVSDILTDLEDPMVLHEIASLLAPTVVSWARFFLDDDGLRPADGADVSRVHEGAPRRTPAVPGEVEDPVQDLLDGRREGPLELDLEATGGPTTTWLTTHLRESVSPGVVHVHAVPGRRRSLGVLVAVPHHAAALDDDSTRTVLYLVARRVGAAVENTRLYEREHRLAEALQRAMLPEQDDVEELDVWSYYAPSAAHAQVGGDWYDVLQVSEGHVALVIGDVVGHDVEAAAAMGQLRSVVRSYVQEGVDPAVVLERVDSLVAGMRVPRSASLVLATMTREGDGWALRYSRAGHLPPLVVSREGVRRLTGAGGVMVGFGDGTRQDSSTHLVPGDVLVLYTDGLIERRDRAMREGLEALEDVIGAVGGQDAAGAGEVVLSRLADNPEDDVAVVVVRVPDPSGTTAPDSSVPRRRRWSLPSEASSIGRARQAVLRTCAAWDVEGGRSAELVVSELVANAVLHGWGHLVLRLFDTGEGLRIEVEDANPAPPVATDGHPGRVGGFGMRIVERLADWGWRPAGTGKLVWARVHPLPLEEAMRRSARS